MISFIYKQQQYHHACIELEYIYTKERLNMIYQRTIAPFVNDLTVDVVDEDGVHRALSFYVPVLNKRSGITKGDLMTIVALILSDYRNVQAWQSLLPDEDKELWLTIKEKVFLSLEEADAITGLDHQVDFNRHYYTYHGNYPWFEMFQSPVGGWRKGLFFCLPAYVVSRINCAVPVDYLPAESAIHPDQAAVVSTEDETMAILPVLWNYFEQGVMEPGATRLVTQSMVRRIEKLNFTPLPVPVQCGTKTALRAQMLAFYAAVSHKYLRSQLKTNILSSNRVKAMVKNLKDRCAEFLPLATLHLKGVNSEDRTHNGLPLMIEYLQRLFLQHHDGWLSMKWIEDSAFLVFAKNSHKLAGLNPRYTFTPELTNMVTGELITPDKLIQQVGLPMLRSVVCLFASLGMLDFTVMPVGEPREVVSPYDAITAVRLTALGRYVLGIDDTYTELQVEQKGDFEVSDRHLIVRVLNPQSPYLFLLEEMASPLGNDRWKVSHESFLKQCRDRSDINRQIDVFKQNICTDPPLVWLKFFESVLQRVQPLSWMKMRDYHLYRVDPSNTELLHLLDSDEHLRSLIIRAEGHLLLVHNDDYPKLVNQLKSHGYLV